MIMMMIRCTASRGWRSSLSILFNPWLQTLQMLTFLCSCMLQDCLSLVISVFSCLVFLPVVMRCFAPSFLIIYPMKLAGCVLIPSSDNLLCPAFPFLLCLFCFGVHGNLNILLQNHIFIASKFFWHLLRYCSCLTYIIFHNLSYMLSKKPLFLWATSIIIVVCE